MTSHVANNIDPGSLYNFLLQQMAAESYFETPDKYATPEATKEQLERGTNRDKYKSDLPFNDGYPGLTRMTKAQAEEFVKKFKIIHQWSDNPCPDGSRPTQPGDTGYLALNSQQILANTGLSATLIRVMAPNGDLTNEYTLSIRSTEMRPWHEGGDGERDKWDTDFQSIGLKGFAFAQLDALEYYYQWLKVTGKLPVAVVPQDFKLNVTGYSLGGHLATVFTGHLPCSPLWYCLAGRPTGQYRRGLQGRAKKRGDSVQEKWTPQRCPFFAAGIRQQVPAPVVRN